jgi:hypothetical protein
MLSCQSEFRYHFSYFSTYLFHRYVISSAILTVVATHLAPTQVSLATLRQKIRKPIRLGVVATERSGTRDRRPVLHLRCLSSGPMAPTSPRPCLMPSRTLATCVWRVVRLRHLEQRAAHARHFDWVLARLEPPATTTTWWRDRAHWWSRWSKVMAGMLASMSMYVNTAGTPPILLLRSSRPSDAR